MILVTGASGSVGRAVLAEVARENARPQSIAGLARFPVPDRIGNNQVKFRKIKRLARPIQRTAEIGIEELGCIATRTVQ